MKERYCNEIRSQKTVYRTAVFGLILLCIAGINVAYAALIEPVASHSSSRRLERVELVSSHIDGEDVQDLLLEEKQLLSLYIVPQGVTLSGANTSQRFIVSGAYSDGLERDVTLECEFLLSSPEVAFLDELGIVSALSDGITTLKCVFGGQQATTEIKVVNSQHERSFSFSRDIIPILTKKGCNGEHCHGGVKGKGGFKLSLLGLHPLDDYEWIVEGGEYQVLTDEVLEPRVPRINLEEPEKSLLLLKPTMQVNHGGELRLEKGVSDYTTILGWIHRGARYQEREQEAPSIERVEVFPSFAVLDLEGLQQLLVTAFFSDGQNEDITDQVEFVGNNPDVIMVTEDGLVSAVGRGESTVTVRAVGHVTHAIVGVVEDLITNYPDFERRNFIDDYISKKLHRFHILPSDLSSDVEFLRRVCLDLTGTLPPPQKVREFLASENPLKREELIETLFQTPEYISYWTFRFADLFRVAFSGQGAESHARTYWEWIRENIATNKPYDQVAQERILAQGYDGPSRHYYRTGGELPSPQNLVSEELRVYFGRRLDCAECHNHPYESWSQNQFWGIAAFFGRLTRVGSFFNPYLIIDDPKGHGEFGQGAEVIHPRTKQKVEPQFFDGTILPKDRRQNPRTELAQWMTSHPYFAEAFVNRMWSYFFGRGIVEPVDDFRSTNPPSHPMLLSVLAKDFRKHGHDMKHLMRRIVNSRTYQLSSTPNETNKGDWINFSRAVNRALDAEILLDAISQASGTAEEFIKANVGDDIGTIGKKPAGTKAIDLVFFDMFPSRFLDVYGRPNRQTIPERNVKPSLVQALHMLAGKTYVDKLSREGSRLNRLLTRGASDREIIEELYLVTVSRLPTQKEFLELKQLVQQADSRQNAFEDLFWGLVASREFSYNH